MGVQEREGVLSKEEGGFQDGQGQFNEERDTYPGGWESKCSQLSKAKR